MKKLSALLICLLMVFTCSLAGCAGFTIDKVKYYNEVLATVGETHITRYDLLTAYNSYGSTYFVQQQGQNEEQALASTLDLLIDRESLYLYASNADNDATYKPTAYQLNSIVKEIFSSMDSQMDTYIKTAKNILNIKSEDAEDETKKDDETAYLHSKYEVTDDTRRAFIVDDDVVFYTDSSKKTKSDTPTPHYSVLSSHIEYNTKLTEEPSDTEYEKVIAPEFLNDHRKSGIIAEIIETYDDRFKARLEDEENENAEAIYNKVQQLFTKDLISYEQYLRDENGKPYSKTSSDLIYRYFKRNYDSQIQSQYLENIRTHYLITEQSKLSIDKLEKEFKKLYTISYNSYNKKEQAYKDAMKGISTNADSILYHPTLTRAEGEEKTTEFGYFIHTLISFNDTQKAQYKAMESLTESKKQEKLNEIINIFSKSHENPNLISPRDLNNGLIDTNIQYSLEEVIAQYNEIKNNPSYTEAQRLSAFIQFMFKFTGDTATLSQGMPYVVGTNGYSQMEEAFTEECIKLMATGNKSEMSSVSLSNIDDMCITSYGIHLVMYVGDVYANDIPSTDVDSIYFSSVNADNDLSGEYNLYRKTINPLTKETYFDMLFDAVYPASGDAEVFTSKNGYSEHEEGLIGDSQKIYKVVKYSDNIKSTTTTL